MTTTERLYYADSHLVEFDARVVSVSQTADGRACVTLDRTAFYPTGGGQPNDTGTLGAARVVDCVEADEAFVLHIVEGKLPDSGATVRGRVDWPRRLDHIQQHTGQHILSQAFVELFGAQTRSFRMTTDACEIDVDLSDPSDERIERAIDRANEIIWDDRLVRVHHVTPEEAARMTLRKDSAREGSLRVIEIEGFDFSPCGGTHAGRTGEVGVVAARQWERAKGLVRVTFAAGVRALADYRRANRTARTVAALFSVGREEATEAAARLQEENKHSQRRLRVAEEIAARAEARELLEETLATAGEATHAAAGEATLVVTAGEETHAAAGGRLKIIARTFEGRDGESLRRLAAALAAHACTVALLGSLGEGGARLVFARSADTDADMNALMREACRMLGGRGGGRPELAQGGGPHAEKLTEALEAAASSVRG
ncbi:MAG: alanyl-tRNA synthetase [Acidobacteriota bacterium]|jgi:alanyl-tRNA synthetase|nr:alanyl-tRNA synthetase [Acidobacteriota bacterium]